MTKFEFEVAMTCDSCDKITEMLAKEKAAGKIDDFEVKVADKIVCVSSCKLNQDEVTDIVKKSCCVKEVKFLGTCGHASKPCPH